MEETEQIEVRLGAMTPWRDLHFAIKGFSGKPGNSYAKVIVRADGPSEVVRLGLGEVAEVRDGVSIRLDRVPPPSEPGEGRAPTGAGTVLLTVLTVAGGDAR